MCVVSSEWSHRLQWSQVILHPFWRCQWLLVTFSLSGAASGHWWLSPCLEQSVVTGDSLPVWSCQWSVTGDFLPVWSSQWSLVTLSLSGAASGHWWLSTVTGAASGHWWLSPCLEQSVVTGDSPLCFELPVVTGDSPCDWSSQWSLVTLHVTGTGQASRLGD